MRILNAILLFLICAVSVEAQLLYRISGNGLERDSYLFATHHLMPVSFLDSVSGLFKAYNDCDLVVGEIVIDEAEAMRRIKHEAFMDRDLSELLSPGEYLEVDSALKQELSLSADDVKKMRPAMIQNMYVLTLYERLLPGLKGNVSMDAFFQRLAEQQDIRVEGLETLDDQINVLFRAQKLERQAKLLVGAIRDSEGAIEDYKSVSKYYKAGELNKIYYDFMSDDGEYKMNEGERFIFLSNRNFSWANRIERAVKENACFIAVGALHLPGDEGLVKLLREKGFSVKAVK